MEHTKGRKVDGQIFANIWFKKYLAKEQKKKLIISKKYSQQESMQSVFFCIRWVLTLGRKRMRICKLCYGGTAIIHAVVITEFWGPLKLHIQTYSLFSGNYEILIAYSENAFLQAHGL